MKKPGTEGDCYDSNGRHFMDHAQENWKLIHGVVINQIDNLPMGHCWIEVTDTVELPNGVRFENTMIIDKSNDRNIEMPLPLYYMAGKINSSVSSVYDANEYRKNILETGDWGPWKELCNR